MTMFQIKLRIKSAFIMENCEPMTNASSTQNKEKPTKGHPLDDLLKISTETGHQLEDVKFARYMDSIDPLRHLRDEFCYPRMKTLGSGIVLTLNIC